MKKLLVIGLLALGAVTFAANGQGARQGNGQPNGMTRMEANNGICTVTGTTERANQGKFMGSGMKSGKSGRKGSGYGMGNGYAALTPEQQKLRTQNSIAIQEKRLDVRKEMAKDNVNWSNVEKLNREMANLRADQQTQMMKFRAENAAKTAAPKTN